MKTKPLPALMCIGVQRAFWVALAVFVLVIVGGAVFLAILAEEDVDDFWLDAGFFGGPIGSGLAAIFFHLARRRLLKGESSL